jgi:hypothetical protein
VILCAGDSITAAGYPGHLQELLERDGIRVQVVNAGIRGDSTAEYLRYLEKSRIVELTNPDWVLLQLGTNDLRIDGHATTTERFRSNLESILDRMERHRDRAASPRSSWRPFRRSPQRSVALALPRARVRRKSARDPRRRRRGSRPTTMPCSPLAGAASGRAPERGGLRGCQPGIASSRPWCAPAASKTGTQ